MHQTSLPSYPLLPLVEVDVHGRVVVDGHGLEGDVGVGQADVDAQLAHDLVGGEGLVRGRDLGLGHVPGAAVVADWRKGRFQMGKRVGGGI